MNIKVNLQILTKIQVMMQPPSLLSHQHIHSLSTSSPRYSSPPPLSSQQSDNLLGSPIPDFRSYGHNFQTSSSHLSSISPTAEVMLHCYTSKHLNILFSCNAMYCLFHNSQKLNSQFYLKGVFQNELWEPVVYIDRVRLKNSQ